jgi:hypothetical protein
MNDIESVQNSEQSTPPRRWRWFVVARVCELLLVLLIFGLQADRLPFEEFHQIALGARKDEVLRVMGSRNRWKEVRHGELWIMQNGEFLLEVRYGLRGGVSQITARRP